jgi:hypothetical protein
MVDIGKNEILRDNAWIISKWISAGENLPAKSGYVLGSFGENVEISGPAPKVQYFSSCLHVQDILRGDCWGRESGGKPAASLGIGRDKSGADLRSRAIKIESRRQRGISQYAFAMHGHAPSRRIAAIFPIWPEPPIVVSRDGIDFPEWRNSSSKNECALARDDRVSGYFSRSFRSRDGRFHIAGLRNTGPPSDDPKAYCRDGQDPSKRDKP